MPNLIAALLLAIFITLFALWNSMPVKINLFFRTIDNVPLSLVILISVLFGVVLTGFIIFVERTKQHGKKKTEEDKKELETFSPEDEIKLSGDQWEKPR